MDVLFLTVAAGGGHVKAAEALKEKIEDVYPGSRTLIVDTFRYVNPIINKLVIGSYLNTVKATPQIYGKLYELAESGDNMYDLSRNINKMLSHRIKNLIREFKPDIIVCTHFFPLQMLSGLKKKKVVNIPVVAVLTDFVTHSFWVHDCIDAYVVAHQYMKVEMENRGVSPDIVFPYGIPVSADFLKKKNRAEIRKEFDLEDKPTVLIMGGSLGFGEVRDTFLNMLNSKKDIQIIVITGKNERLKNKLDKFSVNATKKVKVFSYTNRVADIMDAADFIITKPGGMTISEALVKELPIFIISPIPGQEERNAQYLVNNGAAVRIYESAYSAIDQIIDNPLRIKHLTEMARHLSKPHAAEDIVGLMKSLVERNRESASPLAEAK